MRRVLGAASRSMNKRGPIVNKQTEQLISHCLDLIECLDGQKEANQVSIDKATRFIEEVYSADGQHKCIRDDLTNHCYSCGKPMKRSE